MIQCTVCGQWYWATTGHACNAPTFYPHGFTYLYPGAIIDNTALQRIAVALEKIAGITPASDGPKEEVR